jgi:hypothetical protein
MSFFLPTILPQNNQSSNYFDDKFCKSKNRQSGRTKGYSTFSLEKVLSTAEVVLPFCSKKSTPFQWRILGKPPCRG